MDEILVTDRNAQVEYAHDCYDGWTVAGEQAEERSRFLAAIGAPAHPELHDVVAGALYDRTQKGA